jgi:hypothetical protein
MARIVHCRVPGCTSTKGHHLAIYCFAHEKANRRHGHPEATAVLQRELKPHMKRVEARLARNPDADLTVFFDRWKAVVKCANDILAEERAGKAGNRHAKEAARLVSRIDTDLKEAPDGLMPILKTVCTLHIMAYYEPRRFKSDRAFDFAVVRKIAALTDTSVGSWFNHRDNRVHRVQHDLHPRTVDILARWIRNAIGVLGVQFARLEERDEERRRQQREAVSSTLSSFQ